MGSCTFGSPAKTISPTRSCLSPSKSLLMAYLVRSSRLGSKSSASIEFETSTTSIISTPCAFSSRSFDPNCGRATASMSRTAAVQKRMNLSAVRPVETSGISSSSTSGFPKRASLLRRRAAAAQKISTSAGIASSSQRYCGFANLNITNACPAYCFPFAVPVRPAGFALGHLGCLSDSDIPSAIFLPAKGGLCRRPGRGARQGIRLSTRFANRNSANSSSSPASAHRRYCSW